MFNRNNLVMLINLGLVDNSVSSIIFIFVMRSKRLFIRLTYK